MCELGTAIALTKWVNGIDLGDDVRQMLCKADSVKISQVIGVAEFAEHPRHLTGFVPALPMRIVRA
jgi:hypothetical protein